MVSQEPLNDAHYMDYSEYQYLELLLLLICFFGGIFDLSIAFVLQNSSLPQLTGLTISASSIGTAAAGHDEKPVLVWC